MCTTVHTYLSPLSAASVGTHGTGDSLSLLIANGRSNDHAGRKLQRGGHYYILATYARTPLAGRPCIYLPNNENMANQVCVCVSLCMC